MLRNYLGAALTPIRTHSPGPHSHPANTHALDAQVGVAPGRGGGRRLRGPAPTSYTHAPAHTLLTHTPLNTHGAQVGVLRNYLGEVVIGAYEARRLASRLAFTSSPGLGYTDLDAEIHVSVGRDDAGGVGCGG